MCLFEFCFCLLIILLHFKSLVKPPTEKPDKGIIDISVKFPNICFTDTDNPDPTTTCDFVRECIKKVLIHSNVIDLNELCLLPKKQVWKLDIEIICLNLNGSIVDLSMLSILFALKYCRFFLFTYLNLFIKLIICLYCLGKLQKYDIDLEFDLITPTKEFSYLKINTYPIFITICLIKE